MQSVNKVEPQEKTLKSKIQSISKDFTQSRAEAARWDIQWSGWFCAALRAAAGPAIFPDITV